MTEKELMLNGKLHSFMDDELEEDSKKAKKLVCQYNSTTEEESVKRSSILNELFGKMGNHCYIEPPFRCDYGVNIYLGESVFINYDCIILDMCKVTIGSRVLIGPRVCIYAASHPIYAPIRNEGFDVGKPVTIGNDVWIGGNVVINPGVTIGNNVVLGSGAVVTKDIPDNVIAAGNPCKVIREITEQDKLVWENQKEEYKNLRGK
ncbi:MAG: maa [Clostridiales bacterium]|jgi:maltose O-acetyltransferase|nr:maa [Clostridiales bacterium]